MYHEATRTWASVIVSDIDERSRRKAIITGMIQHEGFDVCNFRHQRLSARQWKTLDSWKDLSLC